MLALWSLTQKVPGSSPFVVMTNIFVTKFGGIFRKNSNVNATYLLISILLRFPFLFQVIDGYCRAVTLWPNDTVKTAFGIGLMFVQFFTLVMVLIICYGKQQELILI